MSTCFREIESDKCFYRAHDRSHWTTSFFRHATDAICKISHAFYVKVGNDPEAKKIQADTDRHQTGDMYLRISQFERGQLMPEQPVARATHFEAWALLP